ncbi:MAG TPA: UDP-N-acetylmuramoyl-L-alanine--D-glutamate ligase [Bacteroidia bacterium]|jgi:UDP-N-acetylmuramoylalanine--D-glutamate ligase|nr:UDP-N-acetylmuramoyl-L-alanine--D-glutamate ligase [Bacteroidia bacterium]
MNKRIVILGSGESGVGSAILAQAKGFDVFVSDTGAIKDKYKSVLIEKNILFEEGKHSEEKILNANEIIKSPGIPEKTPLIKKAKAQGIKVISEIEFAGRYTNAKKICITGSNGKTTTTMLTHHILTNAGYNVGLAGNVGRSLALQVATEKHDYYVIELSSFQLDDMYDFKADIAILLNITPDHLDRYEYKFENYALSKFRVVQNQTPDDAFIYCTDDEVIMEYIQKVNPKAKHYPFSIKKKVEEEGAFMLENQITININQNPLNMTIEQLALQGKHNVYNSMAASIAARLVDVRKENVRESLSDFVNVEHRLEVIATINGVEYINDSKATNVNSVWYALESMNKPVVLIMGGVDKGNDYTQLYDLVKDKVKALVCLGVDNSKLIESFSSAVETIVEARTMNEAVAYSSKLGKKGDVVLLSPACASFDLFQNYEDRGMQFKGAVRSL